jgi:hypothetical protein
MRGAHQKPFARAGGVSVSLPLAAGHHSAHLQINVEHHKVSGQADT